MVATHALTYAQVVQALALSHAAATVNAPVSARAAVSERAQVDLLCPVSLEEMRLRGC